MKAKKKPSIRVDKHVDDINQVIEKLSKLVKDNSQKEYVEIKPAYHAKKDADMQGLLNSISELTEQNRKIVLTNKLLAEKIELLDKRLKRMFLDSKIPEKVEQEEDEY